MERNRTGQVFCVIIMILSALLAGAFFSFPGYSFSGLVCCGILLTSLIYFIMGLRVLRSRRWVKIIRMIFTLLLCMGLLLAAFTGIYIGKASLGTKEYDCEYLIVLGAGVNGTVPSLSLRERLDAAAYYMLLNPDTVCVVSGGQGPGEEITEAACMYDELLERGIPAERIWQEDKATSTQENIRFSLDLIEEMTGVRPERAGILSSEYHLYRAGQMAQDQGLEAVGIPARTSWKSLRINYFLREIAAVWYYTVFGG